jgi:hypothetical protein
MAKIIVTKLDSFQPEAENDTVALKGKITIDTDSKGNKIYYQEIYFSRIQDLHNLKNKYDYNYRDNFYSNFFSLEDSRYFVVGTKSNGNHRFIRNPEINLEKLQINIREKSHTLESKPLLSNFEVKEKNSHFKVYNAMINSGIIIPLAGLYISVIRVINSGVNYLIPASEITRFYFLGESEITTHIFNGTFEELYAPGDIIESDDIRIAQLLIKEGINKNGEKLLAKIAFQKEFHSAVSFINSSIQEFLMKNNDKNDKDNDNDTHTDITCYYDTKIPNKNAYQMYVGGKSFTYDGRKYFLVFQIYQTNERAPFDKILSGVLGPDHRSSNNKAGLPLKASNKTLISNTPDPTKPVTVSSNLPSKPLSIKKNLTWEIETEENIFDVENIIVEKLSKEDQDAIYKSKTKIINVENNSFTTNGKSAKGSNAGVASVGVEEITNKAPENIVVLEKVFDYIVIEYDSYSVLFYDSTSKSFTKKRNDFILDNVHLIMANLKNSSGQNFYFIEFDNSTIDTRLALIYAKTNLNSEIESDFLLSVATIFKSQCRIPSDSLFKDKMKKTKAEDKDDEDKKKWELNNYTLRRINHNYAEDKINDFGDKIIKIINTIAPSSDNKSTKNAD